VNPHADRPEKGADNCDRESQTPGEPVLKPVLEPVLEPVPPRLR